MSQQPDTRHKREKERGGKDFNQACAILDDANICHVGFTLDDIPYVVPMACARHDKNLLLHGSIASRLMKSLANGLNCCATVTHLDGMVYARSAFNSSMNYRSVMVFGKARLVDDADEKSESFDVLVEHLMPGRLADIRPSTRKELNATHLLALPIQTFTTKIRTGPPDDPTVDLDQPVWAGDVPYLHTVNKAITSPDMRFEIPVPDYLKSN